MPIPIRLRDGSCVSEKYLYDRFNDFSSDLYLVYCGTYFVGDWSFTLNGAVCECARFQQMVQEFSDEVDYSFSVQQVNDHFRQNATQYRLRYTIFRKNSSQEPE
jgi:hypothetical protein